MTLPVDLAPEEDRLRQFEKWIDQGDGHMSRQEYPDAEFFYLQALESAEHLPARRKSLAALARIKLACLYDRWGNLRASITQVVEATQLLTGQTSGSRRA
jgi:hypothetical protein